MGCHLAFIGGGGRAVKVDTSAAEVSRTPACKIPPDARLARRGSALPVFFGAGSQGSQNQESAPDSGTAQENRYKGINGSRGSTPKESQEAQKIVVNFVGSICLYRPVSALDSSDCLSYSSHRYNPVQPITGFPQMEKSQMFGKVVVTP